MKLLLDTHYLVWASAEQAKLGKSETVLLEGDPVDIFCSAVSLWELRLKWSRQRRSGERKGPVDTAMVAAFIDAAGWTVLLLKQEHAITQLQTPFEHTDPFDELLLVQAQVEGLRLLTRDVKLRDHPLAHTVDAGG